MLFLNKKNSGFSLVEIILVVAIIIVLISLGMTIDLSVLKSDTFRTEDSTVVSILARARSRAMANMFNTSHGVCYLEPNYVIFQGINCIAGESIPANTNIASNPATNFPTVVFDRLSGNTTATFIHLTDGVKATNITINDEGTINW